MPGRALVEEFTHSRQPLATCLGALRLFDHLRGELTRHVNDTQNPLTVDHGLER